MKVAIYAGMYIKDQDGATKTLYELTDFLLKNKIEVGVWSWSLTPQKKSGLSLFPLWSFPLFFYPDYKFAFPLPRLKYRLDKFKPDIIHVAAPDMPGIFFVKYAKKNKIPIVISYHTDFPSYLVFYKINFLEKIIWRYFHWFYNSGSLFVPTEEVSRNLSKNKINNIKIWSRGIYLDKFNPGFRSDSLRRNWQAKGKKVIIYSGRFVCFKDLDVFVEVYRLFKEKGPKEVVFVLIGDGPMEEELKHSMPEAIFPGYLRGNQLSMAYASADILLFPSITETFGNVIQESLSSGVPAVVSDVGGCQEIVNKSQGGLVARAKDAESFYRCCRQLVTDKNLYRRKRKNGLAYMQDKTWDKINNRVFSEYLKLTGNNPES